MSRGIFRARDAAASRDYYVQALGFQVNFETGDFVSISRGRCGIFLCQGDQGHAGAWVLRSKDPPSSH